MAPPNTPGNPPDKYSGFKLTGDFETDLNLINAQANTGLRLAGVLPEDDGNYAVMGNYKGN